MWVRREKPAAFRVLRTAFPAPRAYLACHLGDRRARPWPARHRPFFHPPTRTRARLSRRGHTAGRSSLCPHRSLSTGAHFGVSSCISMAASRRLAHRCLYLDSCIPTPCIPMPALRPNPGHLTECGSLAGPGPKLITCLEASMVLRRQRGKWLQQRPRELPASPDAEARRAPARRIGAPLVFCVRPHDDWLTRRSSYPHWPSSPSEPTTSCSSCSLEFQPALAVNAREQEIAPAARVAGSLLPLRASGR